MDGLPASVSAAALAVLLVAAVSGKALDRGGWRLLAVQAGGPHRRGTALWLGVPAAELAVAAVLVSVPRAGLAAATMLFAALAVGVARLRQAHDGAPCACFGPITRGRIGRALVVRNVALGAVALATAAVATPAGPLSPTALGLGAALATAAVLAPRVRGGLPRRRLEVGRRLRVRGLPTGRPMVVVLLSPGCPPCEALAPLLPAVADVTGVPLRVAVRPGPGAEALLEAVGPLHDPGLWERITRRYALAGTPAALALDAEGRVHAHGPAEPEGLLNLADAVREPVAPAPRLSRATAVRALALAGVAAAALPLATGAALARGRRRRRRRRTKADPWDYKDDPRNQVDGDCAAFFRRISSPGGGVYAANGDRYANTLGYADVEGFTEGCTPPPPADRLPTAASIDSKRVLRTWRGHCPCPTNMKQYTDESKCKVECPQGLACFGVQCVTDFEEWCVEVLYSIRASRAPQITLTSLQWRPPPSSTPRCRVYAQAFSRAIRTHEEQHARDTLDVLKEWENKNSRRYMRRCAPTQAEAEAAIAAAIEGEREAAYVDLTRMDCERTKAFHQSEAGTTIVPRCEMCG